MIDAKGLLLVLTGALLSLTVSPAAHGQTAHIACVQNGLKALGAGGVAVTEKIDGPTKSATEALRAQYPSVRGIALLPKMSDHSAVGWCREIAALKPSLRRYMPGSSAPLVLGPGGAGSTQTRMLATAFERVEKFYRMHYGIHLASRADVAGASSGKELAAFAVQLQRQRGRSYGRMESRVSKICATPNLRYGGQAYRNQLLICWPYSKSYDAAWRSKAYGTVSGIMAHEYMHHMQRELTNDKVWDGASRHRSKMGPAWMVEGSAELAEYQFLVKSGTAKRKSLTELQSYARSHPKTLRGMHSHGSLKDAKQYRVALFAVYLLAERFGETSVLDYWRYIGQGKSWEAAFKSAFGMSLGSYATAFQTLRADPARAAAFAAGK